MSLPPSPPLAHSVPMMWQEENLSGPSATALSPPKEAEEAITSASEFASSEGQGNTAGGPVSITVPVPSQIEVTEAYIMG